MGTSKNRRDKISFENQKEKSCPNDYFPYRMMKFVSFQKAEIIFKMIKKKHFLFFEKDTRSVKFVYLLKIEIHERKT